MNKILREFVSNQSINNAKINYHQQQNQTSFDFPLDQGSSMSRSGSLSDEFSEFGFGEQSMNDPNMSGNGNQGNSQTSNYLHLITHENFGLKVGDQQLPTFQDLLKINISLTRLFYILDLGDLTFEYTPYNKKLFFSK